MSHAGEIQSPCIVRRVRERDERSRDGAAYFSRHLR